MTRSTGGGLPAPAGSGHQRGFTLLELMVVLVIVGVMLTFVGLSTGGDNRGEQLQRETRRLAALLELASEEAVLRGIEMGVYFGEQEYEFVELQDGQWMPLEDDGPLRPRSFPEGIELGLELEDSPLPELGADEAGLPQVFLLSSGEMTPFTVTLSAPQTERKYQIKATLLGQMELE